jgi:hypothetical protein
MKSFGLICASSVVFLLAGAGCASDVAGLSHPGAAGDTEDGGLRTSPGTPDAGASDAVNPLAAPADPSAETDLPRCGPPPYHPVMLRARDIQGQPGREQAGVVITFKHCPDQKFVTGADGRAVVLVTLGAETWICFQAPGFLPWMVGEIAISEALPATGVAATMVPRNLASTVTPGYLPDRPLVFVQVQSGRSTASEACRLREGVVLGVKGHPDATVLYRATGSNGSYQKGFGTSAEGVAILTGLPADGEPVELVAQKTGCSYTLSYGDANSAALVPILRTPLFPGVITYQSINPAR